MIVIVIRVCTCRPALFLCQADGSLAIMEVSSNTLVGQPTWVQPKNRSQAINMILLGSDGSPLYPQGAHMHLTWPHNNMLTAEPQANIQGRGEFGAGHLEEPLSPVGRHDVEGSSFGTASHVPDDALSNRSARGWLKLHNTVFQLRVFFGAYFGCIYGRNLSAMHRHLWQSHSRENVTN